VLIVKVAEDAPEETAMEVGTDRAVALLVNGTEAPDAGAAFERVTVQEVSELATRLDAAHCTAETRTGATSATEVLAEDPFTVAVMVAV
jgi:hypothetical protein